MIPSQLIITTVSEVPPDRDIIVSMSSHALMDDSDDETEISTCQLENEHPIVTAKEAVRAIKILISAVAHVLRERNYMLKSFPLWKGMQRRF